MVSDLADGELLPARVYLCGGGAELPQVAEVLAQDDWWRRLPFARRPQVAALRPEEVAGLGTRPPRSSRGRTSRPWRSPTRR